MNYSVKAVENIRDKQMLYQTIQNNAILEVWEPSGTQLLKIQGIIPKNFCIFTDIMKHLEISVTGFHLQSFLSLAFQSLLLGA